jgi:hypothetical protein
MLRLLPNAPQRRGNLLLQEKKAAPEENGNAVHPAQAASGPAAAAPPAGAAEEETEAWRHADPYAFLPSPSENNKVAALPFWPTAAQRSKV